MVSFPKSIGTVGGETETGSYQLNMKEDGSADLLYYEYASAKCSALEADDQVPGMVGADAVW